MLDRILILAAGILGASGVAAAAAAAHGGDPLLSSLALIALTQAPAILAIALSARATLPIRIGGAVIAFGSVVFCGDLAARHFTGAALVPMSAPFGGGAIIAGWIAIAVCALLPGRK